MTARKGLHRPKLRASIALAIVFSSALVGTPRLPLSGSFTVAAAVAQEPRPAAGGDAAVWDTTDVHDLLRRGAAAIRAGEYRDAGRLLSSAYELSEGGLRSDISFFFAYALFKVGEEISAPDVQRDRAMAERARMLFDRALILLVESRHPQTEPLTGAIQAQLEQLERLNLP